MVIHDLNRPYQDAPEPLRYLCLNKIIRCCRTSADFRKILRRDVIPQELGELITIAFRDYALATKLTVSACTNFYKNFKHKHIPLSKIDFSGLPITQCLFDDFLQEYKSQLNEINISKCSTLTWQDLKKLNTLKANVKSDKTLIIGDVSYSPDDLGIGNSLAPVFDNDLRIKKLILNKVSSDAIEFEFLTNIRLSDILTPTMSTTLRYLDLSSCTIGNGSALMHMNSLEVLILYNCHMSHADIVSAVCQLTKLRVFDLSLTASQTDDYADCEDSQMLDMLITRLPQLTHLDISGTNLIRSKDRNISAFESRIERPFEFLGLFHTANDAAYKPCIPALRIAGEASETQILNACEAYMNRPEQLSRALNDLFTLYKTITPSEPFDNVSRALDVVLPILSRHISDDQVIVFTTAALWCIVKIKVTTKGLNDTKVRKNITSRLLDVMHYHKSEKIILINGGLTLLLLPEIICEHSRVATISLLMCNDSESRTQGFGTTLLNTLACRVGNEQKVCIGEQGAIRTMLSIIEKKIEENTCDEILETAWSTLWNITDETPANCLRFLQCNGMDAFEKCMDRFNSNKEVLRNIMGLLGNVAECRALRSHFMKSSYMTRFYSLLSSHIDGIECSYNACGILAHLLSDGESFWNMHSDDSWPVTRASVISRLTLAISKWTINSKRNINYRSFEPIIRLLDATVTPAAQYWALFALANLTRINPSKYCLLLLPHDGLQKLRKLCEPGVTYPSVRNLAVITLYQHERYMAEGTLAGLEQCDSIDLSVVKNFRAEASSGDGTSDTGDMMVS